MEYNNFNLPVNIKKFLFDYEHSRFIECNEVMAKANLNNNYQQNLTQLKLIQPSLQYIVQFLESINKHYWLSGGTLLGKTF